MPSGFDDGDYDAAPAQVPTAVSVAPSAGVSYSAQDASPRPETPAPAQVLTPAPDQTPPPAPAQVPTAVPAEGQGSAADAKSEAEQIKSILTNSFGPGVKFEELSE